MIQEKLLCDILSLRCVQHVLGFLIVGEKRAVRICFAIHLAPRLKGNCLPTKICTKNNENHETPSNLPWHTLAVFPPWSPFRVYPLLVAVWYLRIAARRRKSIIGFSTIVLCQSRVLRNPAIPQSHNPQATGQRACLHMFGMSLWCIQDGMSERAVLGIGYGLALIQAVYLSKVS